MAINMSYYYSEKKKQELYVKMNNFNSFLIIIKSEFKKVIAFFVPSKFEESS